MTIAAQETVQPAQFVDIRVCMHDVDLQPLTAERCSVLISIPDMGLDGASCDM